MNITDKCPWCGKSNWKKMSEKVYLCKHCNYVSATMPTKEEHAEMIMELPDETDTRKEET
jgi:ribosomal protein L37AE/L43A